MPEARRSKRDKDPNHEPASHYFDTTLRDGEQALQASLSVKEKLQIALALERMGVDVMEVGFPVSSPGDFESVQTIARQVKNSRVCALARCVEKISTWRPNP